MLTTSDKHEDPVVELGNVYVVDNPAVVSSPKNRGISSSSKHDAGYAKPSSGDGGMATWLKMLFGCVGVSLLLGMLLGAALVFGLNRDEDPDTVVVIQGSFSIDGLQPEDVTEATTTSLEGVIADQAGVTAGSVSVECIDPLCDTSTAARRLTARLILQTSVDFSYLVTTTDVKSDEILVLLLDTAAIDTAITAADDFSTAFPGYQGVSIVQPPFVITASPTLVPTATPTEVPTDSPTATPTAAPTAATCVDTMKNNDETDVDCGGSCQACQEGQVCLVPGDCRGKVCTGNVCATFSPTMSPTTSPTKNPTASPTKSPTASPTEIPTVSPTKSPTEAPTPAPTEAPFSCTRTDTTSVLPVAPFSYLTTVQVCAEGTTQCVRYRADTTLACDDPDADGNRLCGDFLPETVNAGCTVGVDGTNFGLQCSDTDLGAATSTAEYDDFFTEIETRGVKCSGGDRSVMSSPPMFIALTCALFAALV